MGSAAAAASQQRSVQRRRLASSPVQRNVLIAVVVIPVRRQRLDGSPQRRTPPVPGQPVVGRALFFQGSAYVLFASTQSRESP